MVLTVTRLEDLFSEEDSVSTTIKKMNEVRRLGQESFRKAARQFPRDPEIRESRQVLKTVAGTPVDPTDLAHIRAEAAAWDVATNCWEKAEDSRLSCKGRWDEKGLVVGGAEQLAEFARTGCSNI